LLPAKKPAAIIWVANWANYSGIRNK